MKKLFCFLLSLVMILSLAACGEEEASGREKIENIYDGRAFSDGVAVVRCYENGAEIYKVIDKEGYICGESKIFPFYIGVDCRYKNGAFVYDNKIYDKSGKIVASPEKTGYTELLTDARVDGKILAVKIEGNYFGDILYFGTLNSKGEWIEPLSSSHAIANFLVENNCVTTDFSFNRDWWSDDVIRVADNCYYNMRTGEVSDYFKDSSFSFFDTEENMYDSNGYYIGDTYNIYRKTDRDTYEKLVENMCLDSYCSTGFVAHPYDYIEGENTEEYYYYDLNGTLITKLDIVDLVDVAWADGHLVVKHINSTGSYYVSVYRDDGQRVVEPFHYDDYQVYFDCRVYVDSGVLDFGGDYYNFSGEKIVFSEYYTLSCFGEGLFLACTADGDYDYIDVNGNVVID